jgi:hypothetical protein
MGQKIGYKPTEEHKRHISEAKIIHGDRCKQKSNPNSPYTMWVNMRARCRDKNKPDYKYYGGKGIKVYSGWNNYTAFKQWALDNGWKPGLTIDRIDNNGNYEPNNCRFITIHENIKKRNADEGNPSIKLCDNDVYIIRSLYILGYTQDEIANLYVISQANVGKIIRNITWIDTNESR